VRMRDRAPCARRGTLAGHASAVRVVAIAPDSAWLATGSNDGSVRIWDPVTGELRATLTGRAGTVTAIAIAPDGTWLASTDHRSVRIWDPVTGRQRAALIHRTGAARPTTGAPYAPFTGHVRGVRAVAIAPDGTWLATAGHDASVRIWDPVTGELRATLADHADRVTAVAIAPNGTWLASVGYDGSVRIWDLLTGSISALMRVDSPLQDCAWSPSSQSLAAAGDAGLYQFTFNP